MKKKKETKEMKEVREFITERNRITDILKEILEKEVVPDGNRIKVMSFSKACIEAAWWSLVAINGPEIAREMFIQAINPMAMRGDPFAGKR